MCLKSKKEQKVGGHPEGFVEPPQSCDVFLVLSNVDLKFNLQFESHMKTYYPRTLALTMILPEYVYSVS